MMTRSFTDDRFSKWWTFWTNDFSQTSNFQYSKVFQTINLILERLLSLGNFIVQKVDYH